MLRECRIQASGREFHTTFRLNAREVFCYYNGGGHCMCIALNCDVIMRAVCLHFVIICGESLIMRRRQFAATKKVERARWETSKKWQSGMRRETDAKTRTQCSYSWIFVSTQIINCIWTGMQNEVHHKILTSTFWDMATLALTNRYPMNIWCQGQL